MNWRKIIFESGNKKYASLHLRYTPEYEAYLCKNKVKVLYIERDPRDVLVSRVNYLKNGHCPAFRFKHLPFEQLLSSFIGNVHQKNIGINSWNFGRTQNKNALCNIAHLYGDFQGWRHSSVVYQTSFEKLVGPRGGGLLEDQLREVSNIANFLEISLDAEQVLNIAGSLFGSSATFSKGQIGLWRENFSPHHKEAFKKVAPHLLQTLGYETTSDW